VPFQQLTSRKQLVAVINWYQTKRTTTHFRLRPKWKNHFRFLCPSSVLCSFGRAFDLLPSQLYSECSRFHPYRFTFSGVI